MRLRLILNGGISGPHAWFILAHERGYFRQAGLELEFVAGDGGAAVVPRVGKDGIQAGYGDINALARRVATEPEDAPVAVSVFFNRAPFTVAVRADGPVRHVADLAGGCIAGHAHDAALLLFPALAQAAGLERSSVRLIPSALGLGAQVRDLLLPGQVDGVFGYVNTIVAAMAPFGLDPAAVRFLRFSDLLPDLYSHCVMVTRQLLDEHPQAVRGLVHGVHRGLVDTVQDIDAAMAALARAAPSLDIPVQRRRLLGTLREEMGHPEGAVLGIGDVDDARLARSLAALAQACGWPRVPELAALFTREFLPPLAQRVFSPPH